jgi:hypothetical protein
MYCTNSRGQWTRGDDTVCSLGKMLAIPYCKSVPHYRTFQKVSEEVVGAFERGYEFSGFINGGNFRSSKGTFSFSVRTLLHRVSSVDLSYSLF